MTAPITPPELCASCWQLLRPDEPKCWHCGHMNDIVPPKPVTATVARPAPRPGSRRPTYADQDPVYRQNLRDSGHGAPL